MGAVKKQANTLSKRDKSAEYFRGVWSELKKVHWPGAKQVATYTGVVLVTVAIVAILMWIVDSGLTYVMNLLLKK